jgi:hypothetical protein
LRPGDRGGLRVGDVGSGVCAMRKEMRRLSSGVNEGFVGVVGGLLVVFVGGGSAVVGGAMPAVRTDELPVCGRSRSVAWPASSSEAARRHES